MPQQWKDDIIIVQHKKKDRRECGNYRDISLVAHTGNILLKTIARHLSDSCERVGIFPEEQRGFRPNRPTGVGAEKRIPLYVCFIGLTEAYDSVDRTLPWAVLARFGVPQNMTPANSMMMVCEDASMRAPRRRRVFGVVRCEAGLSSRVRARAPPAV